MQEIQEPKFNIKIMNESGYHEALTGLSLSYNKHVHEMKKVADKIFKNGSHGKFLESISILLDITAARSWWQQFDTYRIGVTKQSGSTMHTITHRILSHDDFCNEIYEETLSKLNNDIVNYQRLRKDSDVPQELLDKLFRRIKDNLPESFLQRRILCTNYKTLRHIIGQRKNHKLSEWTMFVKYLQENARYKEWLE
jgi:hypothetical protein